MRDTIKLTYYTGTFFGGTICGGSGSIEDPTDIDAPEAIELILNLLFVYKLDELVLKSEFYKDGVLQNLFEWEKNYK
jgi:hypothetical protein